MTIRALNEAWRQLDETVVHEPPALPPPADERAPTQRYLPAVPEFFGQRCCHPATQPCPVTSQHGSTLAYESLEHTLDLGPKSAPETTSGVVRKPPPVRVDSGVGESARGAVGTSAGGGTALLALLVSLAGCNPPVRSVGQDTWFIACAPGARIEVNLVSEDRAIIACRRGGR